MFGWGLLVHESIPAFLERRLTDGGGTFSVVNLGAPGRGNDTIAANLVAPITAASRWR